MPALKEFANFITLNMANLAETYARFLEQSGAGYENIPVGPRLASARRLLKAVVEAYESNTPDPLRHLFDETADEGPRRWPKDIVPPQPWLEVECLEQTLAPVVTNLEAAKFLPQILSQIRGIALKSAVATPAPAPQVDLPLPSPVLAVETKPVEKYSPLGQQAGGIQLDEQNLLRTLIDNIPDSHIFVKDAQSRFLVTNAAHLQTVGVKSLSDIIGKTDFDFFPQELAEQYYADEQAVIQSGQPLLNRIELVVDQEGQQKWYLTTKVPLYDNSGAVVGLVGMSRDITLRKELEQQVQDSLQRRTLQVQTSTEVAQELAAATTLDELFQAIVNLVQERFAYTYVHVYTLEGNELTMQAGSGEIGRQMKTEGHRMPLSAQPSLIARAARSSQPVLVPDVSHEPDWLPHPLLPETKAELALPIKLGHKVLGVLNIENNTASSLDEEDQLALLGLCGQIAIAINSRRAEAARQRVEQELQVSEAKIHNLLISTDEAVMLLDEKGFIDCNQATLRVFGYRSKEQFINTHPSEQSPPQQPDGSNSWTAANERIATAYREGSNRFEWLHCRADGTPFPAEVLLTRVELEGKPILQAIVRDIAVYKQAQEDLEKERNALHILMDNLPDRIYFKDTDSCFTRISKAQADMFGLSDPAQAQGKTDFDFFTAQHAQPAFEDEQKIINTGQPIVGLEEKETWPDGRVTWVITTKMALRDEQGQIIGTFGISRDITERKLTEQAIARRAAQLEIVAQLSTTASTIFDSQQFLQTVVDLTKERFNLHHAHIYLLDETGDVLHLAAGAGEVGSRMVVEGWQIPLEHEQSLVARAARTRQGVIVNDVHQSPDWLPNPLLPETCAELAVPLMVSEQVVGVLDVQANAVDYFQAEDLYIQTTLAGQIAVAWQNARQYEQTQKTLKEAEYLAREQTVLNELGQALTARLSVEQVLEETYRQASRLIDTSNFYIGLYDREKEQISFPLIVSSSEIDRKIASIPADQGIAGYMILNKTSLLFEDDVQARQEALGITMTGEEALSWLGVPLMIGDRVLGVMAVQSFTTPRLYNEHSRDLLKAIGSQVAIALQNATLFESIVQAQKEVENRLRETQILQRLTQRLAGTLQIDEVVDAFFEACTQLLGSDFAIFSLIDRQQQRIKAIAGFNVSQEHLSRANHPLNSQDIMADIVRTGHTELITGWDARFDITTFTAEGMVEWGLRIFTPIVVRHENIGLVEVGFKEKVDKTVQETQVKLLRTLIDQTAIALENAQRYEASQRAAYREQTIRQITEKMRAATSLDELVKTAALELGEQLSAGHAVVELGIEKNS